MANTTDNVKVYEKGDLLVYHLMMYSDGTNEADEVKVDKSTLLNRAGTAEPASLSLESIRWCMQGFSSLRLKWDRGTDVTIMRPSGNGLEDLSFINGKQDTGSGGTGDILMDTFGAASGATYDIVLVLRKRQ